MDLQFFNTRPPDIQIGGTNVQRIDLGGVNVWPLPLSVTTLAAVYIDRDNRTVRLNGSTNIQTGNRFFRYQDSPQTVARFLRTFVPVSGTGTGAFSTNITVDRPGTYYFAAGAGSTDMVHGDVLTFIMPEELTGGLTLFVQGVAPSRAMLRVSGSGDSGFNAVVSQDDAQIYSGGATTIDIGPVTDFNDGQTINFEGVFTDDFGTLTRNISPVIRHDPQGLSLRGTARTFNASTDIIDFTMSFSAIGATPLTSLTLYYTPEFDDQATPPTVDEIISNTNSTSVNITVDDTLTQYTYRTGNFNFAPGHTIYGVFEAATENGTFRSNRAAVRAIRT